MSKVKHVGALYENSFLVKPHYHDFWEVVYYTKGPGTVRINNDILPFQENDIFIIPPFVPHSDYSDVGFRNYFYMFQDDNFQKTTYLKLKDTENHDFATIVSQLYHEYHLKRKNYKTIVDNLYEVLFQYIQVLTENEESNPYVALIIDEIVDNLSNPYYKISETLSKIPVSSDYIRKLFRSKTGHTPSQYLTIKRVQYAKSLLKLHQDSGMSIQEIAWNAGFSDNYYFSRVFKKITGYSPKGWLAAESDIQKLPKTIFL